MADKPVTASGAELSTRPQSAINSSSEESTASPDGPAPKAARSRTGRPKTRYGCRTCKRRHVKCDETRPSCKHCTRLNVQCSYHIPADAMKAMPLSRKLSPLPTVLPRGKLDTRRPAAEVSTVSTKVAPVRLHWMKVDDDSKASEKKALKLLSLRRLSSILFASQQEQQYFDYYREFTAKQLSGWFQRDVWAFLMMQAAHEYPFVRQGLVAIGAMGKSLEMSQSGIRSGNPKSISSAVQHRQFAFRQYGHAITEVQKSLERCRENGQDNIRLILISCLLTVCFEGFVGNRDHMGSQITHVIKILAEWTRKHQPVHTYKEGLGSPVPDVIEDELCRAFVLLDIKTMYSSDSRSSSEHFEMSTLGTSSINTMPAAFSSVREAEPYFALIAQRALHFLNGAVKLIEESSANTKCNAEPQAQVTLSGALESNQAANGQALIAAALNKYFHEMYHWTAAFEPVLRRAGKDKGSHEYIHAKVLENHTKSAIVRFIGATAMDIEPSLSQPSSHGMDRSNNSPERVVSLFDIALNMKLNDMSKDSGKAALNVELAVDPGLKYTGGTTIKLGPDWTESSPPEHIIKGVEYGFLNPLEAFGKRKGVGPWYQEKTMFWYNIAGVDEKREKYQIGR